MNNLKNFEPSVPAIDISFGDAFEAFESFAGWPSTHVSKIDEGYRIEIVAPGMDKSDFKVSLEGDVLRVEAHVEKKEQHQFYKRSFTQSWSVPPSMKESDVTASYRDGILAVVLKHEYVKSRHRANIEIK